MDKLNTTIFNFFPSKSRTKETYQLAKPPDRTDLCFYVEGSPSTMAFIIMTTSTQIILPQHNPGRQPRTRSPTAEATHCRLTTKSLHLRIPWHAEDDLELCSTELPLHPAAMTHAAKLSSQRAANNSFYSACTHQTTSTAEKTSKDKLLPTSYTGIVLFSRKQHWPLSKYWVKNLFFPP